VSNENPYLAPELPVVVQNQHRQLDDVIDAETGNRMTVGITTTTISVDPLTGGREVEERTVRVRADGRIINPAEAIYACACGCNSKPLLTTHTVRFCTFCQVPLALGHARNWDDGTTRTEACPQCWNPGHTKRALKRLLTWLLNI
jgi:hypothetical protein